MKIKNAFLSLGAVALAASPVVAQTLPTSAPIEGESEVGGSGAGIAIGFGLALLVATFFISESMDNDDDPVSP
ncbi:hypothetical protein [Erythrobacter litoralis]|uniref:Ferrochelatase n=1 Tax=Erythrobacter litoralis (strain HTCC2594) TaxID=314225 RepID=Q2NCS0_ERYLH|nr:hypothetical protein [Erythrobacter litoralis]ABC62521.1 hypothetical protein ELI_02145 [Erythrobacter litoralis HTCC2594]